MSAEQDQTAENSTVEAMDEALQEPGEERTDELVDAAELESPEDLGRLLEDARAKADEHWDLVIRTKAEIDNLKKRHQRELENAHKYSLDKFVGEMLGVWDSLELGHSAAQEDNADIEKLMEGTELTIKMLSDVMQKFGVEQIDPKDQPFDPELHQAISMQPGSGQPVNTVVTVVQKGYTLNGRVVRPAMVVVSQG